MSFTKVLFHSQWALLVVMAVLVAAYRFRLFPFKLAFGGFALSALVVSILALVALVVVILALLGVLKGIPLSLPLGAFVLGLLPLLVMVITVGKGFSVPRIHDISTNTDANIAFINAGSLRAEGENSIELPSQSVIDLQRSFYDQLAPLTLTISAEEAFDKSLGVARELGWEVVFEDRSLMQFEAVDKTALFGFADDIAIRVSSSQNGSTVDMRSVSRVGLSDLGANAKRIDRFQRAFAD